MPTIAAVVVTYNRKALLAECVAALLRQTHPVDRIFLVDNASTDGTWNYLKSLGYLEHPFIEYVRLPVNTGGAGGFHEGMRKAYEADFDWIWIMDDDAEPEEDALKYLEFYMRPQTAAVASMVCDETGEPDHSHHRGRARHLLRRSAVSPLSEEDLDQEVLPIDHASFVGIAFSRDTITSIGLPKAEFFIHYDDFEYCRRTRRIGSILLVPPSRIRHKCAADKANLTSQNRVWKSHMTIRYESLWLYYYGFRNLSWLQIQEYPVLGTLLSFRALSKKLIDVWRFEDHKRARSWFWINAYWDAVTSQFDTAKPRRLLEINVSNRSY